MSHSTLSPTWPVSKAEMQCDYTGNHTRDLCSQLLYQVSRLASFASALIALALPKRFGK
jgi:hypothetical protein